jgi:flagellar biosynthetic protein FlhB
LPRSGEIAVTFNDGGIQVIAEEHGIPIIENLPIARGLCAGVEVDQEIPPEHFKAVGEIIGYVFRLKGKMPKRT